MKKRDCPKEHLVRKSQGDLEADPELRRHLESCSPCRDTYRVSGWLNMAALSSPPERQLPHPSQLWWKAEIIRRMVSQQEIVERVGRPTLWSSGLALATLLVSFTVAMTAFPSSGGTGVVAGPGWLLAAGLAVAPMAALTAFWLLWKES